MITYLSLISISAVMVLSLELSHVAGSQIPRVRGIPFDKNSLYNPDTFTGCLDGSKKIPFKQVNDDYCDCPDGSDEPGTSACSNGLFHCQNHGHESKDISSSLVNDGVCDCCDASDEYNGKINCQNNCMQLGKEAHAEREKKAALFKEGEELRGQMIKRGKELEIENNEKLAEIRVNFKESESIKIEKERIKLEAEEKESVILEKYKKIEAEKNPVPPIEVSKEHDAEEYFRMLDTDKSGTIDLHEMTSKLIFDRDGNGIVSEEEAMYFLGNQDQPNVEEFIYKAWDNIKPIIMKEQGLFVPPAQATPEDPAANVPQDEMKDDEAHDNDETHDDDDEAHEDDDDDTHEEAEKEPEPEVKYTEEEQAIINEAEQSRIEYQKAEKDVMDLQNELRSLEQKVERDYGEDNVFASMDGECYQYTDLEYVYSLCMFGRTTQSSKMGGSEVNLGHWNSWTGPDNNKYSKMKYTNGLTCWNGPARTVDVELICGKENKLIGVGEPSRCEYSMIFTTPALCHASSHHDDETRDEL